MQNKGNAIELHDVCINYSIMQNISIRKTFLHKKKKNEVFEAVKHVSFAVREGDILGIIGKNGSGKSTLLKSIAGVFSPNSGIIDLKGHSVSLMSLGVGFKDLLSGRENIILSGMLLGFSEKEIAEKSQAIIEFAEIGDFIDRPVRTYSSGMYSKLAFAITAMLETDIMLVDEVLSVGDEQFRRKSLAKMKELINDRRRTVLIVSHSIPTLQELCHQVLWLHDGEVRELGDTHEVLGHYETYMMGYPMQ
ncbi:MAG: ABC transporter ATP-binding protein [Eubacterium sp.]|nr:ABC transporter ATP-binding protein [Eubacterium sp.]